MYYFRIKQQTININPFQSVTINAIKWLIGTISRGSETVELNCTAFYLTEEIESNHYSWILTVPNSVLSSWLDDSVIDDFIILNSNGLFEKE